MRKLRVGIVDLVTRGPTHALYARIMHANLASIMPQVVGVWCEQAGHQVTQVCYTGFEDLLARSGDRAWRTPRPLLPRRRAQIFRLCPGVHRSRSDLRGAAGLRPTPAERRPPGRASSA